MNRKDYLNLVDKLTPKEDKRKNYLLAFFMGGCVGAFGEIIKLLLMNVFNFGKEDAVSIVLLIIIFTSCLLTAMGLFDNLVSKFKCGLIIPISGFAHSVMSAVLDYKKDGLITGVGANIFKLAGCVLLYGIVSGFVFGILKVIFNV